MPSPYHIDPEHELILVRPTGRVNEDTFLQLCRALYDDSTRDPQFSVVWDTRSVDELVMDADIIPDFKAFLRENEHRLTQGPVAIVAERPLTRTFASMLIQVGKEYVGPYEIVSSLEEAARQIGVAEAALSNLSSSRRIDV